MHKVLEALQGVTGWLSDNEALWLNHHASRVKEGCIVEIGSFQGKSTIALALDSKVPVYAIDPHHEHIDEIGGKFGAIDRAKFHENIVKAGVHERVCPINLTSDEACLVWERNAPISLLFIDAAHNYDDVYYDVSGWSKWLASDCIVGIHDRTWPDIARLIHDMNTNSIITYGVSFEQYAICDSIQAYRVTKARGYEPL